jgi:hypothetical protein
MYALTHHDRSTEILTPNFGDPLEHTNHYHYPYPDAVVPIFYKSGERGTRFDSLNAG